MSARQTLLDVRGLSFALPTEAGLARVLDNADLRVARGEIHGLVGESGCGKSTLVKLLLGLAPAGAQRLAGQALFDGEDLLALSERELNRRIRARRIGFVPQDPFQSFNPLFKVGTQILEAMRWRSGRRERRAERRARLVDILARVRISEPQAALERYPHELSGGQLQRLTIACALACGPQLILADEPTSALDVTTQQQILILLSELASATGVAVLLVTHDLGLVAQYCERVTIMYAGQTVESLPVEDLLTAARHPYTLRLLDCHPDRGGALVGIPGLVPGLMQMPAGCRFHPRCAQALAPCATQQPAVTTPAPAHSVRCWLEGAPATENLHVAG